MNKRKSSNRLSLRSLCFDNRKYILEYCLFIFRFKGLLVFNFRKELISNDLQFSECGYSCSPKKVDNLAKLIFGYFLEDRSRSIFLLPIRLNFQIRLFLPNFSHLSPTTINFKNFTPARKNIHFRILTTMFTGKEIMTNEEEEEHERRLSEAVNFNFSGLYHLSNVSIIGVRNLTKIVDSLGLRKKPLAFSEFEPSLDPRTLKMNNLNVSMASLRTLVSFSKRIILSNISSFDSNNAEEESNIPERKKICEDLALSYSNVSPDLTYFPSPFYEVLQNCKYLKLIFFRFQTNIGLNDLLMNIRQHAPIVRILYVIVRYSSYVELLPTAKERPLYVLLNDNNFLEELSISFDENLISNRHGDSKFSFENYKLKKLGLCLGDRGGGNPCVLHPTFFKELFSSCLSLEGLDFRILTSDVSILWSETVFYEFQNVLRSFPSRMKGLVMRIPRIRDQNNIYHQLSLRSSLTKLIINSDFSINGVATLRLILRLKNLESLYFNPCMDNSIIKFVRPNHKFIGVNEAVISLFENMKRLKVFRFYSITPSLIYFLKYSSKMQHVMFASNEVNRQNIPMYNYQVDETFLIDYQYYINSDQFDRYSMSEEYLLYEEQENFNRTNDTNSSRNHYLSRVYQLKLYERRKRTLISELLNKNNSGTPGRYFQNISVMDHIWKKKSEFRKKSIEKWKLLERTFSSEQKDSIKDDRIIDWEGYYKSREELEEKKKIFLDYDGEDSLEDDLEMLIGKEILCNFRDFTNSLNENEEMSETEKELFVSSFYVASVRLTKDFDITRTYCVLYSLYDDGVDYTFDFRNSQMKFCDSKRIFRRSFDDFEIKLNSYTYHFMTLSAIDFLRFVISPSSCDVDPHSVGEGCRWISRRSFLRMLYLMCGGMADMDVKWILREFQRVYRLRFSEIEDDKESDNIQLFRKSGDS